MNTSCSDTVKCRLDAGKSPIFRSQSPDISVRKSQRVAVFVRICPYEIIQNSYDIAFPRSTMFSSVFTIVAGYLLHPKPEGHGCLADKKSQCMLPIVHPGLINILWRSHFLLHVFSCKKPIIRGMKNVKPNGIVFNLYTLDSQKRI